VSRRQWAVLAGLLLLGAALRAHRLEAESLWNDELLSLEVSAGRAPSEWMPPIGVVADPMPRLGTLENAPPWVSVFSALRDFTHPPLYFVALRLWREVFGEGDVAARSLSAAAGVLALLLLFDLARSLHGTTAALWATALMTLAGPQIRYGQEARGYTLLLALGLLAGAALVRIEQRGASPVRLLAVAAGALGSVATHYYGVSVPAALGLYAWIRLRGRARRRVLALLLLGLAVFVATWGPTVALQLERAETNPLVQEPARGHVGRTLARAAGLPLPLLTAPTSQCRTGPLWALLAYALPWLPWRSRRDLLFWGPWLCSSVALVTTLDIVLGVGQLRWIRYTLLASPAVYALVAAALPARAGWMRHVPPTLAAAFCLALLPRAYEPLHPPWREIGGLLRLAAEPGDTLVFVAQDIPSRYAFRALSHYGYPISRRVVFLEQPAGPSTLRQLAEPRAAFWWRRREVRIESLLRRARVVESLPPPEDQAWFLRLSVEADAGEPRSTTSLPHVPSFHSLATQPSTPFSVPP
jgi:hypothetical protein